MYQFIILVIFFWNIYNGDGDGDGNDNSKCIGGKISLFKC